MNIYYYKDTYFELLNYFYTYIYNNFLKFNFTIYYLILKVYIKGEMNKFITSII